MKLDITDEQLRTIVSAAILEHLTPERREALLKTAILELLAVKDVRYGYETRKESELLKAFENAVGVVAHDVAREMLTHDEHLRGQVRQLMAEAWERAFDKEREATLTRVSEALCRALTWEPKRDYT